MIEQYLQAILEPLIEYKDQLVITRSHDDMGVLLTVRLAQSDMGKIIGKEGNTIKAVRVLMHTLGSTQKARVSVKILESEQPYTQLPPVEKKSLEEFSPDDYKY